MILTDSYTEVEKLYRLMCFNVLYIILMIMRRIFHIYMMMKRKYGNYHLRMI